MPILKNSPSELAIHGGAPPAFEVKVPAISPNVGDGARFGALAERMFLQTTKPGELREEFESAFADLVGARNAVAFSSLAAASRALTKLHGSWLAPAFGYSAVDFGDAELRCADVSPWNFDLEVPATSDVDAVLGIAALGRNCRAPVTYTFAHQSLAMNGRATLFELGRDCLVNASDAAVIATSDDLLAQRLRNDRDRGNGKALEMTEAAAAMGIANLESVDRFLAENRAQYGVYREALAGIKGINLAELPEGSAYRSITIQVDPTRAGITRNALHDVLLVENVGTSKPFPDDSILSGMPNAARLHATLLQLPCGPAVTEETIETISRLIELAIVQGLEAPDPIRLAA